MNVIEKAQIKSKNILFLKEFIRNWKEVGSLLPSSKFLAEEMVKFIDFKNAKIIVELGPGTGSITKTILEKMGDDTVFIAVDSNPIFCKKLRCAIKDKRLKIFNISASKVGEVLSGKKVDYVVSGLPLALMDTKLKSDIFHGVSESLKEDGVYIQFQYSLESKSVLKRVFKSVKVGFVPFNLPPAFIYYCKK